MTKLWDLMKHTLLETRDGVRVLSLTRCSFLLLLGIDVWFLLGKETDVPSGALNMTLGLLTAVTTTKVAAAVWPGAATMLRLPAPTIVPTSSMGPGAPGDGSNL